MSQLLSLKNTRKIKGVLFIELILLNIIHTLKVTGRFWLYSDFIPYYFGGKILRDYGTKLLYEIDLQRELYNLFVPGSSSSAFLLTFRGSPLTVLLYYPLTFFSLKNSYNLFYVLNILLLFYLLFLFYREFNLGKYASSFLFLAFSPLYAALFLGQPSIILLLLSFFIYRLSLKGKFFSSGLLMSLFTLKAQYLLLGVPLFISLGKGRSKFFYGALLGGLVQFLIFFKGNINFVIDYGKFLMHTETPIFGSSGKYMYSINYLFLRLFPGKPILSMFVSVFLFLALCLFIYCMRKRGVSLKLLISMSFMLGPFLVPHISSQDLVFLLLGFFILLDYLKGLILPYAEEILLGLFLILSFLDRISFFGIYFNNFVALVFMLLLSLFYIYLSRISDK